ncbi:hypothetical protein A9Z42_0092420 [Trichoderma parareesei]|uniref:DUF7896 domain-containing protein n=1 Tax=Trichoderma parareesei TaxID=858221 RepID=A0A2H2ZRJ5_TRIPA|nr:hypothetical protein A9Z42_0092420 [Trichoderma parareesei]
MPFEKCRRCRGSKQYNSEQNAIDHLRRGHFIPKWHPGFEDKNWVHPRQLPAEQMRRWVQRVVVNNPTQPTAPPPPPPPPAPPAPTTPATTPELSTGLSGQGLSTRSATDVGEVPMSPPDSGVGVFSVEDFLSVEDDGDGNHILKDK